ncbi:ATP synthase N, alpha subunit [Syntrophotalea carbinolica DSM 2380]|uniref:ATP synthase subunit alpha 2 n=1 Tax=Syntrophotalea carbinolica (strain DSM 2380 / NBRC 103641 / GraBd1) TaxID=338963 RepID=ATPA2_SYNC1|nr:alternate F1F0 ATPase, F1 subunit alpha [Syntrophotalea carbinolica]Q3A076.1 RecName: Full=ATP synthase subunit alpha 2; AltName: Full=ATP synthase F1 sector subunit alpha 2; AltName: Full=F-ATPase subunit alpha 2 [Syntrophotalea carbinolica DSM 2380]ABA90231.1 ATP synthase N, alpha subunit [Syntrophotalea carbinolica DSM 2380]
MKDTLPSATQVLKEAFDTLDSALENFSPVLAVQHVGWVEYIGKGIARVGGLPGVRCEELLAFPGGLLGLALDADEDQVGVVLFGDYTHLQAGDEVRRTGRVLDVPVGDGLIGRVVNPVGRCLDGGKPVAFQRQLPVERPAPPIMDRLPVTQPLMTGIKVIDALIPIGRGQRELILGDRQTGKTAIAIDAIINQRDQDVVCIYCAIGQRAASVAGVVTELRNCGALDYTIVVVAEGDAPPGLQYIAPYAATSMAEHFMEHGRDVLIVYDDLTRHARAYREISLLLRRPPGREAFPGDIFYVHSRLLERATHLNEPRGGGSLTALPIIETEAQNLSAYIPTNLISITDGQIYLSPELFQKGLLPSVDVGKSVSRVGGKTQLAAYRAVAGDLRLTYAQFEELEAFARFGTRLDEETRQVLHRGRRVRAILKQTQSSPRTAPQQVLVLHSLNSGVFDTVDEEALPAAEQAICAAVSEIPEIVDKILQGKTLSQEDLDVMHTVAKRVTRPFIKLGEEGHAGAAGDAT